MTRDSMQGSWKQIKQSVQTKWSKLTNDDVELAQGKFATLVGSLQQRYGLAKDKAEQELDAFIGAIDESTLKTAVTNPTPISAGDEHVTAKGRNSSTKPDLVV